MQIKKKYRIYFISFLLLFLIAVIWFLKPDKPDRQNNSARLIVSKLQNKIQYYDLIIDSSKKDIFLTNYRNTIDKLLGIKHQILAIGERIKVSIDTILIDFFILSKSGDNEYVTFLKNVNGTITVIEYKNKNTLPDLPLFCDSHFFYQPRSKYFTYKYDSYSLTSLYNTFIGTKIFLSEKFDEFNNVKCPCDETEISNLLEYVNLQFANESKWLH